MGTPFAVANPKQAEVLRKVRDGIGDQRWAATQPSRGTYSKGWVTLPPEGDPAWRNDAVIYMRITDAGRVALELREILGPGRDLTKAQARALKQRYMSGIWLINSASATFNALARIGLQAMGDLTEDGQRIAEVLRKYRVEV